MRKRSVALWSAMMTRYLHDGFSSQVIRLLKDMVRELRVILQNQLSIFLLLLCLIVLIAEECGRSTISLLCVGGLGWCANM